MLPLSTLGLNLALLWVSNCIPGNSCLNVDPPHPFDYYRDPAIEPYCGANAACYCPESGEYITSIPYPAGVAPGTSSSFLLGNIWAQWGDSLDSIISRKVLECDESTPDPQVRQEVCHAQWYRKEALRELCQEGYVFSYSLAGADLGGSWSQMLRNQQSGDTGLYACGSLAGIAHLGLWPRSVPVEFGDIDVSGGAKVYYGPNPCAVDFAECKKRVISPCEDCEYRFTDKTGGRLRNCRDDIMGTPFEFCRNRTGRERRDCCALIPDLGEAAACLVEDPIFESKCELVSADQDEINECLTEAEERHDECERVYKSALAACGMLFEECQAQHPPELGAADSYIDGEGKWPGRVPSDFERNDVHFLFHSMSPDPRTDVPDACWTAMGCADFQNPEFNCMAWAFDFQHLKAKGMGDPYPKLPPTHCNYGSESPYYFFEDAYRDDEEHHLSKKGLEEWLITVGLQDWKVVAWPGSPCQTLHGILRGGAVIAYAIVSEIFGYVVKASIQHFARYEGPGPGGGMWSSKLGPKEFVIHRPMDLVNSKPTNEGIKDAVRQTCSHLEESTPAHTACERATYGNLGAGFSNYGIPYLCIYKPAAVSEE